MNTVFGDVLRQHTHAERITDTANETFVTLRLNGKGATKRNVGEGKTPQPFSGYRVRSGQFIYSRIDARNGAFAIIPSSLDGAVVSKDFPLFDIDRSMIDPGFLLLSVSNESFVDRIRRLSFGATNRQRVKEEVFLDLQLELPPIDEQRRIASILDKADGLRAKRRKALAHLDTLSQSIFHSMFGSTTDTMPLGEVVSVRTGGTPSRSGLGNYGGDIPWVKTTEVQNEPIWRTSEHLTEQGVESSNCTIFPADSVVIAMYGQGRTRGQVGLLLTAAATNQACAVLPPSAALVPSFLFHQLKGMYPTIRALGRGGNQENLNLSLVRSIPICVPPLELQQTFATRVAAVERLKEMHRGHLTELDALFASLQHRAFRGEL